MAGPLLLYQSMRREDCPSEYRCSEGTPRSYWILIGEYYATEVHIAVIDKVPRNPFDDSVIASGSDDGKVRGVENSKQL